MSVRVVNKYKEPYDVYIGRGSVWGNPYSIDESKGMTREVVVDLFRKYLLRLLESGEITVEHLKPLEGKTLGCFCKPQACHGDVIARAVDWALKQRP